MTTVSYTAAELDKIDEAARNAYRMGEEEFEIRLKRFGPATTLKTLDTLNSLPAWQAAIRANPMPVVTPYNEGKEGQ